MRWLLLVLACALGGTGGVAFAEAPDRSIRPKANPKVVALQQRRAATQVAVQSVVRQIPLAERSQLAPRRVIRPKTRSKPRNTATVAVARAGSVSGASRPEGRPRGLAALFQRRVAQPAQRYTVQGSVCGDRAIRGTTIAPIRGRGGCGVPQPVRITEVAGVKLSTPSTIDCPTAQALKRWVESGVVPTFGRRGGGVVSVKVAAHYACRTRNNRPGARLSEHAKGKAIDISAIQLKDGTSVTVLRGWRNRTYGPLLRRVHKAACGPFGTVLGPNSDRFHQDHFHFDTARYRSGPYCR